MNLFTGASESVLQSALLRWGRTRTPNRQSIADFAFLWRFWFFKGGKRCTGAWIYALVRQKVFCNLHCCAGVVSGLRIGDPLPISPFCDDFDVLKVKNAAPAHKLCTGASECVLRSALLLWDRILTPNRPSIAGFAYCKDCDVSPMLSNTRTDSVFCWQKKEMKTWWKLCDTVKVRDITMSSFFLFSAPWSLQTRSLVNLFRAGAYEY